MPSTGPASVPRHRYCKVQAVGMPALLVVLVLLASGCAPGGSRSDGIPTADAPFTLTALDVGQSTHRTRCQTRLRIEGWLRSLRSPASSSLASPSRTVDVVDESDEAVRVALARAQAECPSVTVRLAEQMFPGTQQDWEDEQVVPVDQIRLGEAARELGAPMDEDRAAVHRSERCNIIGRAQDRRRAPSLDEVRVGECRRDDVLGKVASSDLTEG